MGAHLENGRPVAPTEAWQKQRRDNQNYFDTRAH